MNGRTDGWMDGWVDGGMGGWIVARKDGGIFGWVDGWMARLWKDGLINNKHWKIIKGIIMLKKKRRK
jgi:hypothetical protein